MTNALAPRPPETVMRLSRMGSFHQCRLSFMRILLRRMQRESWTVKRTRFDIDTQGFGTALYSVTTPARTYTLVAFAHDLPDDLRSDRVIATAWDMTFTLHDGVPSEADVQRLRANVPLQEEGRVSAKELTLSRANRSVRLWQRVVDDLAAGRQPDPEFVDSVGYLMRTTAVYGSGKFGAADRRSIADRPELQAPFQAEMLTVYLVRAFTMDLVEHVARMTSDKAVRIQPELRRRFGIGNSTGLGMAPFLLAHPRLIHNWIDARETAIARVRNIDTAAADDIESFERHFRHARRGVEHWRSEHPLQQQKLIELRADLDAIATRLETAPLGGRRPWEALATWADTALSLEGQELLLSLMLEPYGHLVDDLTECMHADESEPMPIDGSASVADVRRQLEEEYSWAIDVDWTAAEADARAWYVSEEKLEPRLGERHDEPVGDYEQPMQPGRDAARLHADLTAFDDHSTLADVLLAHPEHRHTARRLAVVAHYPYAEVRDNTIDRAMLPIDLLRAKLSFFGATRFDPRSDRWVRITMFQGAPFPHELEALDADDWVYAEVEPTE